ncbi:MAG: 50S ribosomal protein L10 [Acidobacteria bacterium]|nr:50S ribosomal protein L10 [Acidobacteriota bacterium]
MNRIEKTAEVDSLEAVFSKTQNAFLISLAGLNVAQVTDLRRQIRSTSARCKVVKNRLARVAGSRTHLMELTKDLRGPIAIAYTDKKDPSQLAKVIHTFAKANPKMGLKAGFVQGKVVAAEKIAEISTLPSREELLGRMAYLLAQPLARFAGVLAAPLRTFGSVMKQVGDKKES